MSQAEAGGGMTTARKNTLVVAVLLMAAGFAFSGYGGSIAAPAKLAEIGGTDYYALLNALSTMAMMLALPLVGKLSAVFGIRNLAIAGMGFQLCMRIVCMLAAKPMAFIIAITLSNIGAGLYVSLSHTIISVLLPQQERPKYFGLITTCNALGALAGPLMVGQVVDWGYAGSGYILHAPLSVAAIILLGIFFPKHQKPEPQKEKFDLAGILLLVTGICGVVLWLSLGGKAFAWTSFAGIALPASGICALAVLARVEKRHQNPSIPLRLFRSKRFSTSFFCMFLLTSYSTCAAGFCIFYVQQIMQRSPQVSATVTMPQTIVQTICGVAIGRFLTKNFAKKFRPLALLAPLLTTGATFILANLTPASPMLMIYIATVMGGIAMSIAQTAFTPFFQTDLNPADYVAAQGMYSFGSNGGSCIFSALAGVLLNAGLSYNHIFLMAFFFNAAAFVIGFFGFRLPSSAGTLTQESA